MDTSILELTPAQWRDTACAFGDDPNYRDTAAELRAIADKLERGESPSVIRPAHEVVYRTPAKDPS
jgi:hypothetical protein